MGYPGVPPQPQSAPAASSSDAKQSPDADSIDAYKAAQTILKAINFGNLLQLPAEESHDGHRSQHSGLETLLSHVQAALASSAAEPPTVTGPVVPTPPAVTNLEPAVDPRAELQAHLALLAAQLAEFSQAEEAVQDAPPLPPVPTFVPVPAVLTAPSETQNNDDESDDDDMEEII